jgi:SAM-dependent methyltransferase
MSSLKAASRPSNPKALVRHGWNRASLQYRPEGRTSDIFGHTLEDHEEWLQPLFQSLEPGSDVLDLGCGCGIPDSRLLSERFRVTGVDISDVQLERARRLVPAARFLRADMTSVRFPPESFAAVVCLYSLIHVPLDEQLPLLGRMYRWLLPGGLALVTTGQEAYTGVEDDWLGSNAKMYWSHADASTYTRWFAEAGFIHLRRRFVPEGDRGHALFLARKAANATSERPGPRSIPV